MDVGCGNGVVSKILQEAFRLDICGTDILSYCKTSIFFVKMQEREKLPFEDASFDDVMFNDVLHHDRAPEQLLLEGARVASRIFVFEDKKSPFLNWVDRGINYFYSPAMPCPLNFKTLQEWTALFTRLGFEWEKGIVSYPWWYPFRHFVFKLTKKRNRF